MDCDVLVIGAGPGGCATAYYLRQAGWQVVLVERRTYPVDKLCGEFLSPEGVESLSRMGLGDRFAAARCPRIEEVLVSSASGNYWCDQLPEVGMGCSRQYLDQSLMEHCCAAGVTVVQGMRIREVSGGLKQGFRVEGTGFHGMQQFQARLVVGAFGKQDALGRKLGREVQRGRRDLMALKLHLQGGHLQGRVELHGFPGGYAGLCAVEDGRTNLCLLTRVQDFQQAGCNYRVFRRQIMGKNPLLNQRLEEMEPDWGKVLAVAGLKFGVFAREAHGVIMVGDAAASISPLCGDGMAMALRGAEILAPLSGDFLAGNTSGSALVEAYERKWRREFKPRLRIGHLLQQVLSSPGGSKSAIALLERFPALGQRLIQWTRGP